VADSYERDLWQAGNYVREEVLAGFIRLVCHTAELQAYTAQRLYQALREDISQESLTLATVWIVGEFGDAMLQSGASIDDGGQVKEINPSDIVDLFQLVLDSPYANTLIRQWTLMALAKLAIRFAEAGTASASVQQERIREILAGYSEATELEIQQRAVEFGQLFTKAEVVGGVLEHMPAPELKATIMGTGE
jgi:AP-1 complex subunit gamma-1